MRPVDVNFARLASKKYNLPFEQVYKALEKEPKDHGVGERIPSPMTVYRVEMPGGSGPFSQGEEIYNAICKPGPEAALRLAIANNEQMGKSDRAFYLTHGHANYGCVSLGDVCNWFTPNVRKYLKRYGGKIVEYEVQAGEYVAYAGNGEILFDRYRARKVATLDIVQVERQLADAA